jgi:hypothetical protein
MTDRSQSWLKNYMKRIFCLVLGACNLDSHLTPPPDGAMNVPDALEQRCDLQKDFGVPVPIAELNLSTFTEADGVFSSDLRTAYFRSSRTPNVGAEDLWFATRTDSSGTFGTPVLLGGVNGSGYESKPVLTEDELTIVLGITGNGGDIALAGRNSKGDPFGTPGPVANVNGSANEAPTWMNAAGTRLYMFSDRAGNNDLFVASRANAAVEFGTPMPIDELNSAGTDMDAVLTDDELTVFFGSDRDGNTETWVATRGSTTAEFGAPEKVNALNTGTNDNPSWVSADGCQIILYSNRTGSFDLFLATRPN